MKREFLASTCAHLESSRFDMAWSRGPMPSRDEKDALAGNDGTPSSSNKFATETGNINARKGTAGSGSLYGKVVFVEGTSISMTVDDTTDPNEFRITIAASGAFPGYYGSAPPASSGSGSAGSSSLVSRGDHYHPASTTAFQVHYVQATSASRTSFGQNPGFTPLLLLLNYERVGVSNCYGFGVGTGSSQQQYQSFGGAIFLGKIANATTDWAISSFTSSAVTISGGSTTCVLAEFILGRA